MVSSNSPIGVFDSGVGGLTVYRALRTLLPQENFIYLGDTARVPYGPKSSTTIVQYALQITARLREEGIKLLVVACNTATACALPALQSMHSDLPIIGVVEPGAAAAVAASRNNRILVLATAGTIQSGAYQAAIQNINPACDVRGLPCGILVTLAEEGWVEGVEVEAVLARYLRHAEGFDYDTLVLGCTHFPLLLKPLQNLLPESITIVDSALTTAEKVKTYMYESVLDNQNTISGYSRFMVTDQGQQFQNFARQFLDQSESLTAEYVAIEEPSVRQAVG